MSLGAEILHVTAAFEIGAFAKNNVYPMPIFLLITFRFESAVWRLNSQIDFWDIYLDILGHPRHTKLLLEMILKSNFCSLI